MKSYINDTSPQSSWATQDVPYVHAVVFVPVVVPLALPGVKEPFEPSEWRGALKEMARVPKQVFTAAEVEISKATVRQLNTSQSREFRMRNQIGYFRGLKPFWNVVIIVYAARVRFKEFSLDRQRYSHEEAKRFHEQVSCEAFGRVVRRWLVATLLAKVGILRFSDILVTRSGQQVWERYDDFRGLSSEHLEVAKKMKWPPIKNLGIRSVWKWLQKIPQFNDDLGVSVVGRAVAAFTHLLRRRDPTAVGEVLLWALLGLEALYTKGTAELGSQLAEKTQLLLGEQHDFKKALTRMYAYRSRLIHGDVPIPMHYCEYEGLSEYETFLDEVEDQNYLAANVLVSSLQELVTRDEAELRFEWRVVEVEKSRDRGSAAPGDVKAGGRRRMKKRGPT